VVWIFRGFSGQFGSFGFSGILDVRFFRDSGSFGFSEDVWVWGFRILIGFFLFGLDCFRLLIQRCKTLWEKGNLFDEGVVLPDES
jgi:hypothetical protein